MAKYNKARWKNITGKINHQLLREAMKISLYHLEGKDSPLTGKPDKNFRI